MAYPTTHQTTTQRLSIHFMRTHIYMCIYHHHSSLITPFPVTSAFTCTFTLTVHSQRQQYITLHKSNCKFLHWPAAPYTESPSIGSHHMLGHNFPVRVLIAPTHYNNTSRSMAWVASMLFMGQPTMFGSRHISGPHLHIKCNIP